MIGEYVSHYKICEKLGEGGMGVVYRAEDTRLKRTVALKFLPAELMDNREAFERFTHEAQLSSALSHPNICAVHAIDTCEGHHFIDMEFVEGKTLRTILKERHLPLDEILSIATQIGEGLSAAHKKGIVHRDIKPDNLMVNAEGGVKILDFGLAKLRGASQLTKPLSVLGTAPYMSPEQVQGLEADQRSDVFSLGIVLYAMIAGCRPFRGEHEASLIYSILNEVPAPLAHYQPETPAALQQIVEKALAKDREERYQRADELVADLRSLSRRSERELPARLRLPRGRMKAYALATLVAGAMLLLLVLGKLLFFTAAGKSFTSIAILPLQNSSGDPGQEYFSDGMTEALISELSQVSAFSKVISLTSAMMYKNLRKPLPQIAAELGVEAIMEGSVVQAGNRVRISIQLIDASTDGRIWAKSYNREMKDILELQNEISREVVHEINLFLTPQELVRFTSARAVDPKAHELYLKGRYFWNKRTKTGLERAIEYFTQTIQIDSEYAPAYSGLADCYNLLPFYLGYNANDLYPKAGAVAFRAKSLDSTLAEAATSYAYYLWAYEWNWEAAEREFQRAIRLNPRYSTTHQWYGVFLANLKQFEKGMQEISLAQELDPLSLIINTKYGDVLYRARRYDEAIQRYRKTLEIDSTFATAHTMLGAAYLQKHMYPEALAEFLKGKSWPMITRAYSFLGRKEEAGEVISRLKEASKVQYIRRDAFAVAYLGIGDEEKALEYLELACDEHDPQLSEDINVEPYWDPLRTSARFMQLQRKMGLGNKE